MTKDEILNMPAGDEIDALISQCVFGNKIQWFDGPGGPVITGGTYEKIRTWNKVSSYSTNMAAAWEVVEKVAGEDSELSVRITGEYLGNGWRCVFTNAFVDYDVMAKTAPLAICRAALLAVMDASRKQAENP